jgi:mRNA-decapping enzyme subunit 2
MTSGARLRVSDAIEDLCCRFVINAPAEELASFERICFLLEEAHWFYTDFYEEQTGVHLGTRDFTRLMFENTPLLRKHIPAIDTILRDFAEYKSLVPVYGAVLLDPTREKCLLVQGEQSGMWGFPKGKVNKGEAEVDCAVREVLEETGLDITGAVRPDQYIEVTLSGMKNRLYVVEGVPETATFAPRTRGEVSGYRWFVINDLPTTSRALREAQKRLPGRPTSNAIAFVRKLRDWIEDCRRKEKQTQKQLHKKLQLTRPPQSQLQPPTPSKPTEEERVSVPMPVTMPGPAEIEAEEAESRMRVESELLQAKLQIKPQPQQSKPPHVYEEVRLPDGIIIPRLTAPGHTINIEAEVATITEKITAIKEQPSPSSPPPAPIETSSSQAFLKEQRGISSTLSAFTFNTAAILAAM